MIWGICVIEWLSLPSSDRPSFFTLYFEQPDGAGHTFGPDSNEVNSNMIFVDAMLNYLFHRLDQQQLLGCINIILISDHGMQSLRPDHFIKIFEDERIMNSKDAYIKATSAAHIYLKGDLAKLSNPLDAFPHLMCQKGEYYRAYTAKTMPRNRHYTGRRVGEIFLDTVIGAVPMENKKKFDEWQNKGGHGYNNVLKSMRAIFGALGPSFKTKTTIPPFQNIELYNLFVDVLNLPNRAPNNGTHGTLFTTLKNPPEYETSEAQFFPKCDIEINLLKCGDSCHFKLPLSNETFCYGTQQLGYSQSLSEMNLCELHFCNASIMLDNEQKPIITQSLIRHPIPNIDHRANCSLRIHDGNLTECQRKSFKGTISLFSKNSINYYFEQARIPAPKGFIDGAWKSLVEMISKYTQHYSTLRIWAGPIWDNDNNGLIDPIRNGKNASHVFIVLLRCSAGNWASDFTHCKDETKTRVLSFILPLIEKDYNCLDPTVYLFQNMARVRDVELLTDFEFFIDRNVYSPKMALQLRTEVKEELWQLEQDIQH
uniref:Uncharacterized protein n=1 Tax=Panagrolaimus sp. PS1159 TaxID=55785 RepID=A0AC35G6J1_9BILA